MPDFNSEEFRRSLADTVSWCRIRAIGMNAESDEVRQRQALYAQAEQQWDEAQRIIKDSFFRRKITATKRWRNAMSLLKKIKDSLGEMDRMLRSQELRPSFDLHSFSDGEHWSKAVAEVVARRSQFTSEVAVEQVQPGGRLLLYRPTENLACGAAEHSSNGFFDVNNVPPWDIWVCFSEGTLVSWVPPGLVDVAQMGIYVNPEECIGWAS